MRVVGLLACALLAAGCTPSVATSPPQESPGGTAAATAAATMVAADPSPASMDFSSSELCPGGTGHECLLEAGEHRSLGFGDGLRFTLTDQWTVDANETDVISLETGLHVNPRIIEFITGAVRGYTASGELVPMTDPADFRRELVSRAEAASANVTIVDKGPTTVGGLAATVFDIVAMDSIGLFEYPVTAHGSVLAAGRTARMLWTTWAGAPFIVSIESDRRTFEEFVTAVQPILESLEFGDDD